MKRDYENVFENAVDRLDEKVTPWLDKHGIKLVVGVFVLTFIAAIVTRL